MNLPSALRFSPRFRRMIPNAIAVAPPDVVTPATASAALAMHMGQIIAHLLGHRTAQSCADLRF